uniref:Uracil phosphoribosyltransferase n=1 Tax=Yamadaella caenomyce TaxID=259029 RepID=A0A1G4NZG3_9FLOR|nr:Uracil phosphoribosyltransferase [Yamadaella caenomyce]SCW23899.1 Uracil phosphoribosyltransferase [Yamadaella caenomyce]
MTLNIYTIKHPLILTWTSNLRQPGLYGKRRYDLLTKIHVQLVYELLRHELNADKLYIKNLDKLEEFHIINTNILSIICPDMKLHVLFRKTVEEFSNTILFSELVLYKDNDQWKIITTEDQVTDWQKPVKFTIVEEKLITDRILAVLTHLTSKKQRTTNQVINICCATCSHQELDMLAKQYKNINVYTANLTDA